MSRLLATSRRVFCQLRRDPRTVALLLAVPIALMSLLRLIYAQHLPAFDSIGAPLLSLFPLFTMFRVTSVAILRERTTGTLERLLSTPLRKLELLGGYGLAFGAAAVVQATLASTVALGPLGLKVAAGPALVVVLCAAVALLGMGLGLLASAFAATEFQVVQFFPAVILPQLLLCGLLVPRSQMARRCTPSPMSCRCPTPSTPCVTSAAIRERRRRCGLTWRWSSAAPPGRWRWERLRSDARPIECPRRVTADGFDLAGGGRPQ